MLEFNSKTSAALDRFYKFRNDIDIYTEDKFSDKEFYRVLFKRIIPSSIKINDITPLGSKTNVLKKHSECQKVPSVRKKLFLVDGDLDLITDTNPKSEGNLYVHTTYCIENHLIDESAIVEFVYYGFGDKSRDEVKEILSFENWANSINTLCQLFIYLAILKAYGGGPEVKHATHFLIDNAGSVTYDEEKCLAYRNEVKQKCIAKITETETDAETKLENLYNILQEKWPINKESLLKIVSGKDYLLPLLQFKINSVVKKNSCIPNKNLKLYLINNCDVSSFDNLKSFILALSN